MPTHRLPFLIETNLEWLSQATALLEVLSDDQYTARPPALVDQRAGGHLRHIIEFYECFLDGLDGGRIDYDARRRDQLIETSRTAALSRLRHLSDRIASTPALTGDAALWVRIEGAEQAGIWHGCVASSVGRELQTLSSHTIHHFALIGFVLKLLGVTLPSGFGVAPSTLAYRYSKEAA